MTGIPQLTLADYDGRFAGRHRLHDVIAYWAGRKPEEAAIVHHDRGVTDTWKGLDEASTALAAELLRLGLRKGDFLAASLPFTPEHILLEYACFKVGVIHAPLDLRLSPEEVLRSVDQVRAAGYAFLGKTRAADFRELGRAVQGRCPSVRLLLQFSAEEETIEGAEPFAALARRMAEIGPEARRAVAEASAQVGEDDGAQVIFTTGSTGTPKPALLTHRSITVQNMCLGAAFFGEGRRVLVNLPPSHVGGQAELLMTTLFTGGTAVVLQVFDAAKSIEAIEKYRVQLIGQIPAMFQLEWRLGSYGSYDLSSLETVVYGGQAAPLSMLEKMRTMAPEIATGLGLTEASGFCTYTPLTGDVESVARSLGGDMPVYRMSIRRPMKEDGSAGEELPDGETGHVCFQGPQTFSGYVNDPEATRRTVSTDGVLYTGDLGYRDADGLHLAGRSRWVMKPRGYQVFPGQVEEHFLKLTSQVAACGVVGVEHALFTEGIVAFVEKKPEAELTVAELKRHARSLTAYMRPQHYVVLEPGTLPLNRVAKTDYVRLAEMARQEVERLRTAGMWDR